MEGKQYHRHSRLFLLLRLTPYSVRPPYLEQRHSKQRHIRSAGVCQQVSGGISVTKYVVDQKSRYSLWTRDDRH
jgi:hypothetical protein